MITRLISIVSKPIKVVVVVIVIVVFVKKKLGQKIFDPKIIHVQKNIRPKSIGSENFGVKIKVRSKKVLVKKMLS